MLSSVKDSTPGDGQERRRSPRHAVSLAAALIRPGLPEIRCEIRDFCPAGLFLKITDPGPINPAQGVALRSPIFVEFVPPGGGDRFVLSGFVARLTAEGVGMALDFMPKDAFDGLSAAAVTSLPQAPDTLPDAPALAMREACRKTLLLFMEATLDDFFLVIGARLNSAAIDLSARSVLLGGFDLVTRQAAGIRTTFLAALEHGFEQPLADSDEEPESAAKAPTLSLVETDKFEDWLALSSVIHAIETTLDGRLTEIEQRYATLTGRPMSRKNLPFGPNVILRTWQRALEGHGFDAILMNNFYKVFGEVLGRRAERLYRQFEEILAPVPYSPPSPVAARKVERAAPGRDGGITGDEVRKADREADMESARSQLEQLYRAVSAIDAETPVNESGDDGVERMLASLAKAIRHGVDAGPADSGGRHPRAPAGAPRVTQHQAPPGSPTRVAGELLHALRAQPAGAASPVQGHGASRHAEPDQVLAALNGISLEQNTGALSVPSRVQSLLADGAGGPSVLRLPQQQILSTVEALLGKALAQKSMAGDVRNLVGRLERSLYKLAITDEAFPETPGHPGRQVLNLLDQFSMTADDNGQLNDPQLVKALDQMVERLAGQDIPEVRDFADVGGRLEEMLEPLRKARAERVVRLQEASENRYRIKRNKAWIDEALNHRLGGRQVPEIIVRLLQAGWRNHLILQSVREGPDSPAMQRDIDAIDHLLNWLDADHVPVPEDARESLAVRQRIEEALRRVAVDTQRADRLLDDLGVALMERRRGESHPATATVWVPPEDKPATADDDKEPAGAVTRQVNNVRVGDWYQFTISGRVLPLQLTWVGQDNDLYVFANRSATKKLEVSRKSLSRLLRNALITPIEDVGHPLMERSEGLVIQDAYGRIYHDAMHDSTTGLFNRKGFLRKLEWLVADASASGLPHVLFVVEFDQLRAIYNSCGPGAGDSLLRVLSAQMQALLRKSDLIGHLREGTYGILLPNCPTHEGRRIAEQLLARLGDFPFRHEDKQFTLGVNIGQIEFTETSGDAGNLLRQADSACMASKNLGRNRMQEYEAADSRLRAQDALQDWAGKFDRILAEDRLFLRAQEIRPLESAGGLLPHYEILLGVRDESGNEAAPTDFILAAENWRRMVDVDLWILRRVFAWIRANPLPFESTGGFSLNLSGQSLVNRDVLEYLLLELATGDLPTEKLTFEITETAALASFAPAMDFIREIRRFGCRFSLDDFGSGFSTYAYLKNLSVDFLKIDGSFVKDIADSPTDLTMVKSMNEIGHSLNLRTIAEYAETPQIVEMLRDIGVDYVQGYAIHRPLALDQLTTVLNAGVPRNMAVSAG